MDLTLSHPTDKCLDKLFLIHHSCYACSESIWTCSEIYPVTVWSFEGVSMMQNLCGQEVNLSEWLHQSWLKFQYDYRLCEGVREHIGRRVCVPTYSRAYLSIHLVALIVIVVINFPELSSLGSEGGEEEPIWWGQLPRRIQLPGVL